MRMTRNRGNKKGVLKNKQEKLVNDLLVEQCGKGVQYEKIPFEYTVPEKKHVYTPDFVVKKSKLIVECKGRFMTDDRQKMICIKEQYPDWRVCMFFTSMYRPLYKGSKSTYKDWCDKYGIECTDIKAGLPKDWK